MGACTRMRVHSRAHTYTHRHQAMAPLHDSHLSRQPPEKPDRFTEAPDGPPKYPQSQTSDLQTQKRQD